MSKYIKYIKVIYYIVIIVSAIGASWMAIFLGVMATDAPGSGTFEFTIGFLIGFLIIFIPTSIFPILSIRELNKYEEKRGLIFNYITSIVLLFIFIPLALLQMYFLYKLNKSQDIQSVDENNSLN